MGRKSMSCEWYHIQRLMVMLEGKVYYVVAVQHKHMLSSGARNALTSCTNQLALTKSGNGRLIQVCGLVLLIFAIACWPRRNLSQLAAIHSSTRPFCVTARRQFVS